MKKLVIKTALITIACLLVLAILIYGILAIFSPKTLATVYQNFGNDSLSVKYTEKQYNKTKDIEDLYLLCVKLDYERDSEKTEEYTAILTSLTEYNGFCKEKDNEVGSVIKTHELIEGKFVCAVYKNGGIEKTVETAKGLICEEYSKYNCINTFIITFGEGLKGEEILKLKNCLIEIKMNFVYGESLANIENDINLLEEIAK